MAVWPVGRGPNPPVKQVELGNYDVDIDPGAPTVVYPPSPDGSPPNPPNVQDFDWRGTGPKTLIGGNNIWLGHYRILGPTAPKYMVMRWVDTDTQEIFVGLFRKDDTDVVLVDSQQIGYYSGGYSQHNRIGAMRNDDGMVGAFWNDMNTFDPMAAIITSTGDVMNVDVYTLTGNPSWYDVTYGYISQDSQEFMFGDIAANGWSVWAYNTDDGTLSWSNTFVDPNPAPSIRYPLFGAPKAGRALLVSYGTYGAEGIVYLGNSNGDLIDSTAVDWLGNPSGSETWLGCGSNRVVTFEYDTGPWPDLRSYFTYRALDCSSDTLTWLQDSRTVTPSAAENWFNTLAVASTWRGQMVVFPNWYDMDNAAIFTVNPVELDSISHQYVEIPYASDILAIAACGWSDTMANYQYYDLICGWSVHPYLEGPWLDGSYADNTALWTINGGEFYADVSSKKITPVLKRNDRGQTWNASAEGTIVRAYAMRNTPHMVGFMAYTSGSVHDHDAEAHFVVNVVMSADGSQLVVHSILDPEDPRYGYDPALGRIHEVRGFSVSSGALLWTCSPSNGFTDAEMLGSPKANTFLWHEVGAESLSLLSTDASPLDSIAYAPTGLAQWVNTQPGVNAYVSLVVGSDSIYYRGLLTSDINTLQWVGAETEINIGEGSLLNVFVSSWDGQMAVTYERGGLPG